MTTPRLFVPSLVVLAVFGTACTGTGVDRRSVPAPAVETCADPVTAIPAVQGAGDASPRLGERVAVRGRVVGEFQRPDQLEGFFLQAIEGDGDPATSDGIFIHAPDADVGLGDLVRVAGVVAETDGLTQLREVASLARCGAGRLPAPAALDLRATRDLEQVEGMRVRVAETLVVVDTYLLARHGRFVAAAGGRPFAATNGTGPAAEPAPRLAIDDGSRLENPDPVPFLFDSGTLRVGTAIDAVTGVVAQDGTGHHLHPTGTVRLSARNPRPDAPPAVGGDVRVAAFNVLNFFTTFGERGAKDAHELERQRAKLVAALHALEADVVGLMELENNGDVALRALVAALNERAGADVWAAVPDPPGGVGDDAIRLGLIYRPARVQPVGPARVHRDPAAAFDRPPLAQTFETAGERWSVVVNHFKSKGCGSAEGAERDQGDGQGCWNPLRTRQARSLLRFVAELQAVSGDHDLLVIGDLNAYGGEDPIRVLRAGGLVDLIAAHVSPAKRYSYVYRGTSGYLDYVLATPSLAPRVTGAGIWHVNADEPVALDYRGHNPPSLYRPDPFRSSDHDPVLVGLDL